MAFLAAIALLQVTPAAAADGDPTVSISDSSVNEGNTGTVNLEFVISLDATSDADVVGRFVTFDRTATAGVDYTAVDQSFTIAAGSLSTSVMVPVNGDEQPEHDESVTGSLRDLVGANMGRGQGVGTIVNDDGSRIDRRGGENRIETAVSLSRLAFSSADTVVIARSDQYADALAGGPLAARYAAPLLLSGPSGLSESVKAEIQRLGATKALLLGGTAALSTQIEDDLAAAGIAKADQTRFAGENRFGTAQLISADLGGSLVYVVEGINADSTRGWPDAVMASGIAALDQAPVLLVTRDGVPPETIAALDALNAAEATIVGGTSAVSSATRAIIDDHTGTVTRISGESRFHTSVEVVQQAARNGANVKRLYVATGLNYPDALAAGAALATDDGVLLLVRGPGPLDQVTIDWLDRKDGFDRITVIGGPAAISPDVYAELEGRLN